MTRQNFIHVVVLGASLLVLSPSTTAQEPSHPAITPAKRALITELLEVTESKKTAVAVYEGMLDQQRKMTREVVQQRMETNPEFMALSPDEQEKMRKTALDASAKIDSRLNQLFEERINFPQLIEEISYELNDKYFTEEELKDLINFYRSPTGKKAISVVPKMFAESMELAAVTIQPKLIEIMNILAKEESDRLNKELEAIKEEAPVNKPGSTKRRPGKRRP